MVRRRGGWGWSVSACPGGGRKREEEEEEGGLTRESNKTCGFA